MDVSFQFRLDISEQTLMVRDIISLTCCLTPKGCSNTVRLLARSLNFSTQHGFWHWFKAFWLPPIVITTQSDTFSSDLVKLDMVLGILRMDSNVGERIGLRGTFDTYYLIAYSWIISRDFSFNFLFWKWISLQFSQPKFTAPKENFLECTCQRFRTHTHVNVNWLSLRNFLEVCSELMVLACSVVCKLALPLEDSVESSGCQ